MKAVDYGTKTNTVAAFVSTNSICQGQQVSILWPVIFATGYEIAFAHTSFKWANLASHNAGVTVVIVGISNHAGKTRRLFSVTENEGALLKEVENINAYLVSALNIEVHAKPKSSCELGIMQFGNHPYYGASLIFSIDEAKQIIHQTPEAAKFIRPLYGSKEFISGLPRACLWIEENNLEEAIAIPALASKVEEVVSCRLEAKKDVAAQKLAKTPYRFRDQCTAQAYTIVVPRVSSENRPYLPAGLLDSRSMCTKKLLLFTMPLFGT